MCKDLCRRPTKQPRDRTQVPTLTGALGLRARQQARKREGGEREIQTETESLSCVSLETYARQASGSKFDSMLTFCEFVLRHQRLLGEDWSHLFPPASIASGGNAKDCFKKFQSDLETMAAKCDAYNAAADSRSFPDCYPMYVNNPRVLETSVSV